MLRPAGLLPSLSRALDTPLGSVGSLLPAGVCYRALRRLPGQDLHLLEQRVFQDAPWAYCDTAKAPHACPGAGQGAAAKSRQSAIAPAVVQNAGSSQTSRVTAPVAAPDHHLCGVAIFPARSSSRPSPRVGSALVSCPPPSLCASPNRGRRRPPAAFPGYFAPSMTVR